ncbi:DUF4192 domain-containing protein [Gordonia sp. 'Campus']|uniref:DUF4192 domain-containing protein n=1 Tax=Gordonia sp. 'Campus' TaxID=2915824 RepID=UPI001EE4851D|nr:DUF4192 domain-containing protein [Gordonia sp. 'Campus']
MPLPSPSRSPGPHDPTTLLTAIPAALGFVPERSIIVIAFTADRSITATMRHDLALHPDGTPTRELSAVLAGLADITESYGTEEVVAVIADDRHPADDPRYRRILAMADRHFSALGGVAAGFGIGEFVAGAPWTVTWCPDGRAWAVDVTPEACGLLDDPHTCAAAVAEMVRSGRRILLRRSEIRAMLDPVEGECGPGRPGPGCAGCIVPQRVTAAGRDDASDSDDPGVSALALDLVIDSVVDANLPLDCATVARLQEAIVRLDVRDAAMALAVTAFREHAERVWRELTRRLTGRGRASAATLLAHLHYIGGEGVYAGAALDVAIECDPDAAMANLLDTALRNGVRPSRLWDMIDTSYAVAARLGVSIPAVTLRAAG